MRWLGLSRDGTAGGSTHDDLTTDGTVPADWEDAAIFVPVTTAQVDPGLDVKDRNNEVRGRRGNVAPVAFASTPSASFSARAYPELLRALIPDALGNITGTTGAGAAARTSTVKPIQEGNLPARFLTVLREEQIDRLSGAVVSEFTLDLPAEEEGTLEFTMPGLYHEPGATADAGALPTAAYAGWDDTFMLRDVVAKTGAGAGVAIDCLAGFGLTFNNGLVDDFRSRFCAGENVKVITDDAGKTHRLWYPRRHKIGPQAVTGRLDFGVTRPDLETRRLILGAEKLVVELSAGVLGTTPPVVEMARITIALASLTGGGAGELVREGDITSTYEFTGYIDPATNEDLTVEFVGSSAVAFTDEA